MKLSRVEMKNVLGGDPVTTGCILTLYGPNYTPLGSGIQSGTNDPKEAEARCVNLIAQPGNGVYHCKYKCDGGAPA